MAVSPTTARTATCPSWCAVRHGRHPGEDDTVHVSGALMVRGTLLRICMTHDPDTDTRDGPYVLVGPDEYALHEAEALIDALTQLVDRATGLSPRAGA